MPFQKGHKQFGGKKKGTKHAVDTKCAEWASKFGLGFLQRVAEGKESDVNMFGKPCIPGLRMRTEITQYLIDRGLGKPSQKHEVSGEDGAPIQVQFTLEFKT